MLQAVLIQGSGNVRRHSTRAKESSSPQAPPTRLSRLVASRLASAFRQGVVDSVVKGFEPEPPVQEIAALTSQMLQRQH